MSTLEEKITRFFNWITIIWLFGFFISLFLLNTKYELISMIMLVFGLVPIIIGKFAIPVVYPRVREQRVKRLIPEIKSGKRPLVQESILVSSSQETVYSVCLGWLNYIDAVIYETDEPRRIIAFHEVYDKRTKGEYSYLATSSKPKNLPKFFQFTLSQNDEGVDVNLEIFSGWKDTNIDGIKRITVWKAFVQEFTDYIDSWIR